MKIYVASSWRNEQQQEIVRLLREAGHEVYDFKNPRPGDNGFHWSEIDPNWKTWTPQQFREGLRHATAVKGFWSDMDALQDCDVCVMVMPFEAGWAIGAEKPTIILLSETHVFEPELMYLAAEAICIDIPELLAKVEEIKKSMRRCRVCGCTDDNACDGGCYWVEDDLCSECAPILEQPPDDEVIF